MSIPKTSENLSYPAYEQYKPMPQVREGDWVCIRCSNFNFSFRTTCNRCKAQTRDTNFFEFIFPQTPRVFAPENELDVEESTNWETEKTCESNKENNPFRSAVLLTPIKNQRPQTDGEPYKSPSCLPSVSPLLKKYNNYLRNQNFSNTTNITSSPYSAREFKEISVSQFNISGMKPFECQQQGQDMEYNISQLLASIDL